jgi:hypothetical protein
VLQQAETDARPSKCGLIVTRMGRKIGFPSPCSGAKCAAFFWLAVAANQFGKSAGIPAPAYSSDCRISTLTTSPGCQSRRSATSSNVCASEKANFRVVALRRSIRPRRSVRKTATKSLPIAVKIVIPRTTAHPHVRPLVRRSGRFMHKSVGGETHRRASCEPKTIASRDRRREQERVATLWHRSIQPHPRGVVVNRNSYPGKLPTRLLRFMPAGKGDPASDRNSLDLSGFRQCVPSVSGRSSSWPSASSSTCCCGWVSPPWPGAEGRHLTASSCPADARTTVWRAALASTPRTRAGDWHIRKLRIQTDRRESATPACSAGSRPPTAIG